MHFTEGPHNIKKGSYLSNSQKHTLEVKQVGTLTKEVKTSRGWALPSSVPVGLAKPTKAGNVSLLPCQLY